jgi:hypothetical protein
MLKERDGPTAIVDLLGNSFAARSIDVAQTTFAPSDANAMAHAAPMPLVPDISATLPFGLPAVDILPDLNFHYGVSLSSQFALQHVFDEAVKLCGADHMGIVSSTL